MIHKGEIVEQAIRKSGMPIATIATRLGKSRRWMYLMFENPNVSLEIISRIGQIIHYNFEDELLISEKNIFSLSNPLSSSENTESIDYWKNKYFLLLEEHNALLKKFSAL